MVGACRLDDEPTHAGTRSISAYARELVAITAGACEIEPRFELEASETCGSGIAADPRERSARIGLRSRRPCDLRAQQRDRRAVKPALDAERGEPLGGIAGLCELTER